MNRGTVTQVSDAASRAGGLFNAGIYWLSQHEPEAGSCYQQHFDWYLRSTQQMSMSFLHISVATINPYGDVDQGMMNKAIRLVERSTTSLERATESMDHNGCFD